MTAAPTRVSAADRRFRSQVGGNLEPHRGYRASQAFGSRSWRGRMPDDGKDPRAPSPIGDVAENHKALGEAAIRESGRHAANQANAERSTGPRSPSGKATSALNAVKHGLSGKTLL